MIDDTRNHKANETYAKKQINKLKILRDAAIIKYPSLTYEKKKTLDLLNDLLSALKLEDQEEEDNKDKNILLKHMENINDKLFKNYSDGKIAISYVENFIHITDKKDKENIVKEINDINNRISIEILNILFNQDCIFFY